MPILIDVTTAGGHRERLRVLTIDMVVAERELIRSGASPETHRIASSAAMAWSAYKRAHPDDPAVKTLDGFLELVEDLEDVDDETEDQEEEDPTRQADTPG